MIALVRLIHPAPTAAVVLLSAALGGILLGESDRSVADGRLALTVVAILGSQVLTGALNDWADRERDARHQPSKPIPAGHVTPRAALALAGAGLAVQVLASIPLGATPLVLGLAASASAVAYDLRLSRTVLSFVPYLVSFAILPIWIATGVGIPVERVAAAPLLVGPFAVAAHLANTLRDFDADARAGSGNLAQRIGRRAGFRLAWGLAMAVGLSVGVAFGLAGRLDPLSAALGIAGGMAIAQGVAGPHRLWYGMLLAAVAWTAAWAVASA